MDKSIDKSAYEQYAIEEGIYLLKVTNEENRPRHAFHKIDKTFIQFHFCLKGRASFRFNEGSYLLQVSEEESLLLYNTQKDLPLDMELQPQTWCLSVIISIQKFHGLFTDDAAHIPFLNEGFKEKKYYGQEAVTPGMAVVLSQLMSQSVNSALKSVYLKGKVYELIALYFNKNGETDAEQCPFLADEANVAKIKRAKEIILENLTEPPTLQELSNKIALPLKKLKEGFRQIYGDSVYGYLLNHKMDLALKLLESGKYNVNEVGLKVGYSTASHFIAAFKKKYGTTPKKYLTD